MPIRQSRSFRTTRAGPRADSSANPSRKYSVRGSTAAADARTGASESPRHSLANGSTSIKPTRTPTAPMRHGRANTCRTALDGEVVGFYALDGRHHPAQESPKAAWPSRRLGCRPRAAWARSADGSSICDAPGPWWSDMIYRIHDLPVGEMPALDTALEFYPPEARGSWPWAP